MSKMESFSWLYLLFLLCTSQFICLSSFNSSSSSGHLCHLDDSSALLQFKNSFAIDTSDSASVDAFFVYGITPYPKTVYWDKGKDCCAWSGVTCERMTGHVVGLNLGYSGLQGNIHHNSSLFSLRHLRRLDLSNNNFGGSPVSSNFGGFVSMTHLDLSNSNFTGQIPFEISYLSKLVSINLSSETQVSLGTVSLKRIAQNLTNLKELCLDGVNMSSVVLDSFMNLSSSLTSLSLVDSNLKGKFPEKIFRLPNLHELDLSYNHELNGSFPKSNWSSPLKFLALSWTRISIDLPYLTTTLKCLSFLYLKHCNFVGAYPTLLLGNLTQITRLDLSDNGFGGQIPWSLLNMESLISLDLSNNNFSGQLPDLHSNSTQMPVSLYDSSKERLVGPITLHLNELFLYNNSLTGTIPSWLYILPSLEALSLSHNQLTGNVKEFQSSSLVYLNFGHNRLHGQIPRSIFEIPILGELDLSSNNFSGFVKFGKFPKPQNLLRDLDLSNNSLTGIEQVFPWENLQVLDLRTNLLQGQLPIPPPSTSVFYVSNNQLTGGIPSKICNLSSLVVLDLSNNSLSGEIPSCIGNLTSHNLSIVDLHMNKFLGAIPSTFTKDSILTNLDLNGNKLEGPLPRTLLNCRKLELLDLGNNEINDTFPNWLESLPMLQVLILRSNKFHGPIISQKTRFPFRMLRIMDLSHNQFSGLLPRKYFENLMGMIHVRYNGLKYMDHGYYQDTVRVVIKGSYLQLGKILVMFTTIDFSNNIFVGDIPMVIGKLKSLKGLNFSHNQLTGNIPRSFGNLTSLEWLDISANRLVGEIPRELADLPWLAKLNLSENRLVGSIPNGKQFDTFENDSYNGNLGLCGLPLSRTCVYPLPSSSFQQEDDLEDVNGFHWKVVWMGYGIGMVIGISTGYLVLSTGKLDCAVKEIGRELRSKMVKKPKQSLHVHKVRSRNE